MAPNIASQLAGIIASARGGGLKGGVSAEAGASLSFLFEFLGNDTDVALDVTGDIFDSIADPVGQNGLELGFDLVDMHGPLAKWDILEEGDYQSIGHHVNIIDVVATPAVIEVGAAVNANAPTVEVSHLPPPMATPAVARSVNPASAEAKNVKSVRHKTVTKKSASHPAVKAGPAVRVETSIMQDRIICLEDGKAVRNLTEHLIKFGLTPAQYRKKWNLPKSYPMIAPSQIAKRGITAEVNLVTGVVSLVR